MNQFLDSQSLRRQTLLLRVIKQGVQGLAIGLRPVGPKVLAHQSRVSSNSWPNQGKVPKIHHGYMNCMLRPAKTWNSGWPVPQCNMVNCGSRNTLNTVLPALTTFPNRQPSGML